MVVGDSAKAPLDVETWNGLVHAYGVAGDIPPMLEALTAHPEDGPQLEPWYGLWSALCHQGDVFSASFAATPWIVDILAADPGQASDSFFHLPLAIELARFEKGLQVPVALHGAFFLAIRKLAEVAAVAALASNSAAELHVILGAIALGRGDYALSNLLIELNRSNTDIIWKMFENGEI